MKKQLIKRGVMVGSTLLSMTMLATSYAMAESTFSPTTVGGPLNLQGASSFGFNSLPQAINTIISVIFFVAALAAFFFILWGAVQYITAGDDAGKTENARKRITNAVVGLILVALVYVIWLIIVRIVPGLSQFFAGA